MRAIMVAVDYTDLLAVTLPYNAHHFEEVWVVTSHADYDNVADVAHPLNCRVLATDLFYANSAVFNKWAVLEWGLDQMGRHGWLCLMDADVLWPKEMPRREMPFTGPGCPWDIWIQSRANIGTLYTPLRRMCIDLSKPWNHVVGRDEDPPDMRPYPPEYIWKAYPIHRNVNEWAGYSQIFHADDPHLGSAPWHQTDWEHGGGADSLFQAKWPREYKVRPPWECLHLGPAGQNWYGRATQRLDGSLPQEAAERLQKVSQIWTGRRELERQGVKGEGRFVREKLPPSGPAPEAV